ncbi:MAG: hypothetical protein MUF80_05570, partial [Burkholderiales bacterium]|nr:hypothetical protein [Burkholderiales bacterium]
MTLRTKLTGAVGALLMGSIALTAWGFYVSERRLLLLKMRDTQQALLDSFGQTCHDSLLVRDDLAAINAAKSLLRSVDVVEAYCLDGQGIVMAHSDIGRVGKLFSPTGNSKNNEVWMEPDGR